MNKYCVFFSSVHSHYRGITEFLLPGETQEGIFVICTCNNASEEYFFPTATFVSFLSFWHLNFLWGRKFSARDQPENSFFEQTKQWSFKETNGKVSLCKEPIKLGEHYWRPGNIQTSARLVKVKKVPCETRHLFCVLWMHCSL